MSRELRDHASAKRWLSASLALVRLCVPSEQILRQIGSWLMGTIAESMALPPAGIIADVGLLLLGRSLDFSKSKTMLNASLQQTLRSYEDQVLGRLVSDRRYGSMCDAIAKLDESRQALAIGMTIASIAHRLSFSHGITMQPGFARQLIERPSEGLIQQGFLVLLEDVETRELLSSGYNELVHGALRSRELITDSDVFNVENIEVLGSLTQRVANDQILDIAQSFNESLPKKIGKSRKTQGPAPTQLEDESAYPIGGFSSISTSGTLENLVSSELIYMEENNSPDQVDLFDMRYVEQELLYYTRDEAIFVRKRRVVSFLLMPNLVEARFKDVGTSSQRLATLQAVIVTVIKKLVEWLGEEELHIRLVFVRDDVMSSPLGQERDLFALLFRELIDKGLVTMVDHNMAEELLFLNGATRRALSQAILCSTKPMDKPWTAMSPSPRLLTNYLLVHPKTQDEWADCTLELLQWTV